MSRILNPLRGYAAYAFLAVGIVWVVVAYNTGSYLVLWPVITCFASGILLRLRPGERLTWAWASSTAVLGFLLSGYQAYVASSLVGGALSSVATISVGAFSVFAVVHLLLLYAGNSSKSEPK
jgi:hypothetical protein